MEINKKGVVFGGIRMFLDGYESIFYAVLFCSVTVLFVIGFFSAFSGLLLGLTPVLTFGGGLGAEALAVGGFIGFPIAVYYLFKFACKTMIWRSFDGHGAWAEDMPAVLGIGLIGDVVTLLGMTMVCLGVVSMFSGPFGILSFVAGCLALLVMGFVGPAWTAMRIHRGKGVLSALADALICIARHPMSALGIVVLPGALRIVLAGCIPALLGAFHGAWAVPVVLLIGIIGLMEPAFWLAYVKETSDVQPVAE